MIFAMDPSMTAFGWAALGRDGRPDGMGCVRTEKGTAGRHVYVADDDGLRVDTIARVLVEEIRTRPWIRVIATEAPAGAQHAASAKALGLSYGCVRAIGVALELRVVTVQAHEPRTMLCQSKNASKADVEAALRKLYPETRSWLFKSKAVREGAYDALAVAHTVAHGTIGDLVMAGGSAFPDREPPPKVIRPGDFLAALGDGPEVQAARKAGREAVIRGER